MDTAESNQYSYNGSFTFFDRLSFWVQIEKKQTPSTVFKLNTVHTGVFTYQPKFYDCNTSSANSKLRRKDNQEHLNDKDSWSIIVEETSLDYDHEFGKLLLDGHTLPCLHSDGFYNPTLKHLFTFVWFPKEFCLLFHIRDYIGRMSRLNYRFCFETDVFFDTTGKNTGKCKKSILPIFCFLITNHPCRLLLPLSQDWKFPHKNAFSVGNQHKCIQRIILTTLSFIAKVLIWKLEKKTHSLLTSFII